MKKVYWHIEKQMIKYHLSSSETKAQTTTEIWRGIEVVITRRSWKPFVRKGAWVRIPPSPLQKKNWSFDQAFGEVPKWLKGLPWKGSRSLVAARGFKSLLLRSVKTEKLQEKSSWQLSGRHDILPKLLQERNKNNFKKVGKTSWQAGNNMI